MIEIDGSNGSGGGQILRSALAASAITGKPFSVKNLRAKRKSMGLAAQHLTAVRSVAELCNASVVGAKLGSTELTFNPGKIKSGSFKFNIGTAGAITLVLQALVPAAIRASGKSEFEIIGGTNAEHAPSIDYFEHILLNLLRFMGIAIELNVKRYGFFPRGGGIVKVKVEPCSKIKPINLTQRGILIKIDALSKASLDLKPAKVAERQVKGLEAELKRPIAIKWEDYVESYSAGSAIHAHAHFQNTMIGADALGKRGKPAEKVGKECAEELLKELNSDAVVDKHASDQLMIFMALAGSGKIMTSEITEHAKTNAYVLEKFFPVKFEFEDKTISLKRL